eukprot:m.195308 g.195308  ORF g.195308 m.195308 type:complete len:197 (+) comp15688_c0_seq7:1978-2568(+)
MVKSKKLWVCFKKVWRLITQWLMFTGQILIVLLDLKKSFFNRQMAYIYSEMNEHLSAASSLLSAYKAEGERNVDTFITHCVYLARGGEIEDGIAKLRDTIDKWPERRIRISYEIGTVYRDIGSKDKAKDIYNEILEVQSESNEDKAYLAKTLVNLGVFFYENRDIPSAIQHFETALKHDPGHEHARKNLQALRGNK